MNIIKDIKFCETSIVITITTIISSISIDYLWPYYRINSTTVLITVLDSAITYHYIKQ